MTRPSARDFGLAFGGFVAGAGWEAGCWVVVGVGGVAVFRCGMVGVDVRWVGGKASY